METAHYTMCDYSESLLKKNVLTPSLVRYCLLSSLNLLLRVMLSVLNSIFVCNVATHLRDSHLV